MSALHGPAIGLWVYAFAAVCWSIPVAASAQFAPPGLTSVNPGARSTAMGGAFVALADDATAALANPAGLLELSIPEVSFEFRSRHLNQFVEGEGTWASATTNGLSFLSFVYPKEKWALAFYLHQSGRWADERSEDIEHSVEDVAIDTYAASAAFQAGSRVRVGGGMTVTRGKYNALLEFLPPYTYREEKSLSGTKFGGNVGVLVSALERSGAPVSRVQLGAMYRWQQRYDAVEFRDLDGNPPYNPLSPQDVFTVGASVGFGTRMLASFEFMALHDTEPWTTGTVADDDSYEFVPRVGFEYISGKKWRPAGRAGYWREGAFNEARTYRMRVREFVYYPNHFTFGGGLTPHRRFEINAGVDYAPKATMTFFDDAVDKTFFAVVVSTVIRFVR